MGGDTLMGNPMMIEKQCYRCNTLKPVSEFHKHKRMGYESYCRECQNNNSKTRMWVNGKYVPKSHPLHKPGKYKNFEDAAFSSLAKYETSVEGQVYVIVNPSFPEWVKVGMAIDSEDRLNGYQTSSPFRDYMLNYKWNVNDRRAAESEAHTELQKLYERRSEWFKCTPEQAQEVVSGIVGKYQ